jgi:hypothetical protein
MNIILNISKQVLFLTLISLIVSCATEINIVPKFTKLENTTILIDGKIDYTGNKEYFPRTVGDSQSKDPLLIIKYQYQVNYGKVTGPEGLNVFNPLLIVGFPIGQDTLVVVGKLDIIRQKEVIKTYSAICTYEKTRNLFYQGPTFSELRRTGLLNIRDNIEAQMYNNREFLLNLRRNDFPENNTIGGVE